MYGLIEIGDSRVRSAKSLNLLIKEIFTDAEITISQNVLSMKETPIILLKKFQNFSMLHWYCQQILVKN